jgi:sigma-B regulation protein RsbU (phosphoserine phosphatase)
LGLEEDISPFVNSQKIQLDIGDTVIFYTDGIPEAENASGDFYGLDLLCEQILKYREQSVDTMHDKIITNLHQFIGKQEIYDDITLMVIRREI